MPDLLSDQLSRLAPEVDMAASRAHFEARRDGGVRFGSPAPRRTWLLAAAVAALLVAGVVGLVALRGDDTVTPADQADDAATTLPAPEATGTEFELLLVEEVAAPFHELFITGDQAEFDAAWAALGAPVDVPPVDFTRRVAVVLTRPDNACPDTLVRFDVDGSTWTPVFAVETGGCNEPLISWVYVVAVERSAAAPEFSVSLPADELYDAPARAATAVVAPPTGAPDVDPASPQLAETGVRLPLPEVGRPQLHATNLGFLWVVQHEDGTASVLPALVDLPADEDEGGMSGLAARVVASTDGATFGGPRWEWDAWGRTIGGPRSDDLVGYGGEVRGSEVVVFASDASSVPGEPVVPPGASRSYGTAIEAQGPNVEPLDLETYLTLSSIGPRLLDATLVVEDGLGRICDIDPSPAVPDLETCGSGIVVDTTVTSSQPDITAWYFGPLLVEFDTVGVASRVASLGGLASRNDGLPEFAPTEIEVIVESAVAQCRRDGTPVAMVELVAGADTAVNVEIQGDGGVLGRGYVEPRDGVLTPVEIVLDRLPTGPWTVRVLTADHGTDEMTSASFDPPPETGAC